ncbi:hypothetical protein CLAIMM_13273 [Cladophialophora immunda]|nr:hypothetical protein CLAIMM_13273 [Cladophialophora immunda]
MLTIGLGRIAALIYETHRYLDHHYENGQRIAAIVVHQDAIPRLNRTCLPPSNNGLSDTRPDAQLSFSYGVY